MNSAYWRSCTKHCDLPQNGDTRVSFLFRCFQMKSDYMGALVRDDVFNFPNDLAL